MSLHFSSSHHLYLFLLSLLRAYILISSFVAFYHFLSSSSLSFFLAIENQYFHFLSSLQLFFLYSYPSYNFSSLHPLISLLLHPCLLATHESNTPPPPPPPSFPSSLNTHITYTHTQTHTHTNPFTLLSHTHSYLAITHVTGSPASNTINIPS